MLMFSDISQKILYDTSKAEGEFLSLINSTVSHEMRNPLNTIINQCHIMYSFLLSLLSLIDGAKSSLPTAFFIAVKDIHQELC
jgi:signal transduction histidine kinase